MKSIITIALMLSAIFSYGQVKNGLPRTLQHEYSFATNVNDDGQHLKSGKIDWNFTDSLITKATVGPDLNLTYEFIKTDKPFVLMDTAGLVVFDYETDLGTYSLLYSDGAKNLVSLVISLGKKKKIYSIHDVVGFVVDNH